jgi:hypothetical protein
MQNCPCRKYLLGNNGLGLQAQIFGWKIIAMLGTFSNKIRNISRGFQLKSKVRV